MKGVARLTAVSLLLVFSSSLGLVTGYRVEPVTAAWSGWAPSEFPNNFVAQTLVANFDTPVYAELFSGTATSQSYSVELKFPGENGLTVAHGDTVELRDHVWVRCTLEVDRPDSIIKGRTYEVKWTLSGGSDSLRYYYSDNDPYQFGDIVIAGEGNHPMLDLCMRLLGTNNPVDSLWLGANCNLLRLDTANRRRALDKGRDSLRIHWMRDDATSWNNSASGLHGWDWTRLDSCLGSFSARQYNVLGLLAYCSSHPDITTQPDTTPNALPYLNPRPKGPDKYPPRQLWRSLDWESAQYDTMINYWARYVDLVTSRCDSLTHFEVWNEANAYGEYFGCPDTLYYRDNDGGWVNTVRERCSLYVKMCSVAAQIAHSKGKKVVAGGTTGVNWADPVWGIDSGSTWLRTMFELARDRYGGWQNCFDIISVHPYQGPDWPVHKPVMFWADLDTARAIVTRYAGADVPVWVTEMGWPLYHWKDDSGYVDYWGCTKENSARNLCKFLGSTLGSELRPQGGYDRIFLYELTDLRQTDTTSAGGFGLLDSMGRQPCNAPMQMTAKGRAARQMDSLLRGWRVSSYEESEQQGDTVHVLTVDSELGGENGWLVWHSGTGAEDGAQLLLPASTDSLDTIALATDTERNMGTAVSATDGWLNTMATPLPAFYFARGNATRPDLVVDSVVLSPWTPRSTHPLVVKAYVRNHGTRSLPSSLPGGIGFYFNGTPLGSTPRDTALDQGQTMMVSYTVPAVPDSWRGAALFSARANPDNDIVELGTDDNSGYVRAVVRVPPQSNVAPVTGGRSCVPRVILNLSSISFENDSLPCESLLLLQARFGLSDTVPDTIIASGWFGAKSCTTWQFLAGEGRYRFACQSSDSGGNVSDTAWHDTTFITFDSTPRAVSVAVNSGDAFANDASVLVSWAGTDSLSPACSVRLGNAALVNVVAGSGFGASDTLWRFFGAQADGPSGMVSLPLGVDAAAVWQSLPASAYGALTGHWVRLSADALVQGWSGTDSTVGGLEYGYLYTAEGEQSPDTLFYAAVTVDIPDGPAACIGQERLEYRFTCPAPSTISEYELQAAYVRCLVGGSEADTGFVWLDNLKLERFGPDSEPTLSGWLPPDSVQTWTLSSGDGRRTVWLAVHDASGNETRVETCDSINLDETPPVAAIVEPTEGSKVNCEFKLLGAAYDPLAAEGQDWFESYRLEFRHVEAEEWTAVEPQSDFFEPAVPYWDSTSLPVWYVADLGYWNTEGLEDGEYYVRLTVTDSAGNQSHDETWYQLANGDGGDFEMDASGPDGGGTGLGEGSILVGSATGVLKVFDEDLNLVASRTVTDSGTAAYISGAVRLSPDTLLLLNARAHTLLALGSTGEPVRLARGLGLPTGIAKDASGAFWLTDKLSGRLARYKQGEGLELITDSLGGPEAVGTRGDRVYVADTRNNRIAVYDTSGAELPSITGGFTGPQAIALPEQGGIYLTEPQTGAIKGITSDGTVYYTLGNTTVHKGLLSSPDGTRLYTLKPAGNRVLSYRIRSSDSLPGGGQAAGERNLPRTLTLGAPRPNPSNRQTQLSYGLPRSSRVSIRLYDAAGRQCANLADCQQKAGWYHLTWDGRGNGRALPAGVYFVQLSTDLGRTQKKLVRTE